MDGSLSPQWATAEPTLQIPSVSFEDEGTYECEAENSKGRDSVQGRIIVQGTEPGTPSPLSSLLSLRKPTQNAGRTLGSPVKVSCPRLAAVEETSAVASSGLQAGLQKAHGRLYNDSRHKTVIKYQLFGARFSPQLHPNLIQQCRSRPLLSDMGTAAPWGWRRLPAHSQPFSPLLPTAQPEWLKVISDREADIGSNLRWGCAAAGKPRPTVRWLRNGEPLTSQVGPGASSQTQPSSAYLVPPLPDIPPTPLAAP